MKRKQLLSKGIAMAAVATLTISTAVLGLSAVTLYAEELEDGQEEESMYYEALEERQTEEGQEEEGQAEESIDYETSGEEGKTEEVQTEETEEMAPETVTEEVLSEDYISGEENLETLLDGGEEVLDVPLVQTGVYSIYYYDVRTGELVKSEMTEDGPENYSNSTYVFELIHMPDGYRFGSYYGYDLSLPDDDSENGIYYVEVAPYDYFFEEFEIASGRMKNVTLEYYVGEYPDTTIIQTVSVQIPEERYDMDMGLIRAYLPDGYTISMLDGTVREGEAGMEDSYTSIQVKGEAPASVEEGAMYRLYNPANGEHLYTADLLELADVRDRLKWIYEGISWVAPQTGEIAIVRLYNPDPAYSEHHYTADQTEINYLVNKGWLNEGIKWYSNEGSGEAVHRLFNPDPSQPSAASHHYTKDQNEIDYLVAHGWIYEGVAWYGVN